jgi:beta-lactamase class D
MLIAVVACVARAPFASATQSATPAAIADCFAVVTPGGRPEVSDAAECAHKTAPASTFKIPHALIALQAGVITGATAVDLSDAPQRFPSWRRRVTVESAIAWSVLPFFDRTATLIGPARMVANLNALGYGSQPFDAAVPQFWITGDLVVSPMEQLAFLQRFFAGTLPITSEHVALVRRALTMAPGRLTNASGAHPFELSWPPGALLRAKTGNTRVGDERVSWLVGAVEWRKADYVFVARRRSNAGLESLAGADVARRGLNAIASQLSKPRGDVAGRKSIRLQMAQVRSSRR